MRPPIQMLILALLNVAEEHVKYFKDLNRFGEFVDRKKELIDRVISGE